MPVQCTRIRKRLGQRRDTRPMTNPYAAAGEPRPLRGFRQGTDACSVLIRCCRWVTAVSSGHFRCFRFFSVFIRCRRRGTDAASVLYPMPPLGNRGIVGAYSVLHMGNRGFFVASSLPLLGNRGLLTVLLRCRRWGTAASSVATYASGGSRAMKLVQGVPEGRALSRRRPDGPTAAEADARGEA